MSPALSTPLSDDELDELDEFLVYTDATENAMDLSMLDGFFAALLCGPRMVMPSEWLPWVWDCERGDRSPRFRNDDGEPERILELMMRHMNDVATTLHDYPEEYEPVILESSDEANPVPVIDEWCWGFVTGIHLDADGWQPLLDEHPEWMETILRHGTEEGANADEEEPPTDDEHRARAESLADDVRQVYAWWLERRQASGDAPGSRVMRRDPVRNPPKVGRNEPCPCGSGRKFKQCHGAGSPTIH